MHLRLLALGSGPKSVHEITPGPRSTPSLQLKMSAFISLFRSDPHESKLRKLDEEIKRLDELVKKKKELNNLKKSLLESEVVTDLDSESDVDSGSEYDPNEEEIESDIEEEHRPVNARKGRPQHCSYCGEVEHKTTTCYDRSWDILVRLRLNKDALRDFVAQM